MGIRAIGIGLATLAAAAACTTPPRAGTPTDGRPAVRQIGMAHVPEQQALHAPPRGLDTTTDVDPFDPASIATRAVVDQLHTAELTVTDLGVDLERITDGRATVRVLATHTTRRDGSAAEHTSIHVVDLTRDEGRRWTVTSRQLVR